MAETTGVRFCFAPDRDDAGAPVDGGRDAGRDASTAQMDTGLDAAEPDASGPVEDASTIRDAPRSDTGPCVGAACGDALDVCVGGQFACALRTDNQVVCWGGNGTGALGDGTTATERRAHASDCPLDCSTIPVRVQAADGSDFHAEGLACANSTVCAYDALGAISCWGSALNWNAGLDPAASTVVARATRVADPLLDGTTALVAGAEYFCATTPAGHVCWGTNLFGELGTTDLGASGGPRVLPGSGSLSTGSFVTCLADGATVSCRGADNNGQLGPHGSGSSASLVALDPFPATVSSLAGGSNAACALVGADVWCWGYAGCGTLAGGLPASSGYFRTPLLAASGTSFDALWGGGLSARMCARTIGGEVECWGELGVCTMAAGVATHVPALDGAQAIALGHENTCMIDSSGRVACSGRNAYGQLGRAPVDAFDPVFNVVCVGDACL